MSEDTVDQSQAKKQVKKAEIFSSSGKISTVQDEHGNITIVKDEKVSDAQEKAKKDEGGTAWQSKD